MPKRSNLEALRAREQQAQRHMVETHKAMRETEAALREEARKVREQILLALGEMVERAGLAGYPTDVLEQELKAVAVQLEIRGKPGNF